MFNTRMYSLSSLSSASIEDVGRMTDGPKLFQVYVFKAGVARALTILRQEIERDMALLGCRSVADLSSSMISEVPGWSA